MRRKFVLGRFCAGRFWVWGDFVPGRFWAVIKWSDNCWVLSIEVLAIRSFTVFLVKAKKTTWQRSENFSSLVYWRTVCKQASDKHSEQYLQGNISYILSTGWAVLRIMSVNYASGHWKGFFAHFFADSFSSWKTSQNTWVLFLLIESWKINVLFLLKGVWSQFTLNYRRNFKSTGWTKSPKYFIRLFDFLQILFAIRTVKGLQITCFTKKSFQNHTCPHQSPKF